MAMHIKDILLKQTDLPTGYKSESFDEVNDVMAARYSRDPDSKLKELKQRGYIIKYQVQFEKGTGTIEENHIQSNVTLLKDSSGAETFNKNRKEKTIRALEDIGSKCLSFEEIIVPKIGDNSWGFRARCSMNNPESQGMEFNIIGVDWRRSNAECSVSWISTGSGVFRDKLIFLCNIQDSRLVALIEESHGSNADNTQATLDPNVVLKSSKAGCMGSVLFCILIFSLVTINVYVT